MDREPTIDEVIGRMIMVGVRGATVADASLHADLEACREAHVGGIILFDVDLPTAAALAQAGVAHESALARAPRNIVSPEQTRTLCATLREALRDDVLIAVDQEGGAVARLAEHRGFGPSMAAADFARLDADGRTIAARRLARQTASAGFGLNFAPCVDLATNPDSAIIAGKGRAFSDDPRLVAACAACVVDAHHELGVSACLKHFPGHGSAAGDTHEGFVDITHTHTPAELLPYEWLLGLPPAEARVEVVMTGHLFDARVDPDHPASLSHAHTTGALRRRLRFEGVVVVDSLDMAAVTARYAPDEAVVLALNAGADVLLDCNNGWGPARACPAPTVAEAVRRALRDGRIEGGEHRLRDSWRRICGLRGVGSVG